MAVFLICGRNRPPKSPKGGLFILQVLRHAHFGIYFPNFMPKLPSQFREGAVLKT
jgi:hypothetical protein